jgi:low temperature requirement protein LtrA
LLLELGAAGLVGSSAWHIAAGHFAERHGLIYIIALGEGIVAVGIIAAGRPFDATLAFTMLLAVAGAAALWWSYFDRFTETVEDALRRAGDSQGVLARDAYSMGHYPMIAGVVLFAASAEEIVLHPGDPMGGFARLLVALSIGLAMAAQAAVILRAGGRLLIERISAALVIALLMVPSLDVRANLMLLVVLVVLIAALAVERRRHPIRVTEI